MAYIPICPPPAATKEARAVYEEFHTQMGFPSPPAFILTQGHSPTVARGTWDLVRRVLVQGVLPRAIKEMMFVAISYERNCRYCTAAHIACCKMLGVDPLWIELSAGKVNALPDPRMRDMILFALKCAMTPQAVTMGDYAILRAYGLSDREIVEIVSMAGLSVYANILADATGMEEDPQFSGLEQAVTSP
jgi:uncharacterized peroxidase-related enzyme